MVFASKKHNQESSHGKKEKDSKKSSQKENYRKKNSQNKETQCCDDEKEHDWRRVRQLQINAFLSLRRDSLRGSPLFPVEEKEKNRSDAEHVASTDHREIAGVRADIDIVRWEKTHHNRA